MFLTFLSRLMSSLLTTLLFVIFVGFSASQTILNTNYIESQLDKQNAYSRLSDGISEQISKQSQKDSAVPMSQAEVQAKLKTVLTPEVLKQKIDTTLKQLQAYYKGTGPVPTLDISDLVLQAEQAGLPIENDKFEKPITLTATTKGKKASDAAKLISIGTVAVAVVLFLGVLAIALKRRDFRPLANIVFSLGLMLSVTGGALLFVPKVFNRMYKFDDQSNPLGTLAHDLAIGVVHDFALRMLLPGVGSVLVGIILKVLLHKKRKAKHTAPTPAEAPEPATPITENLQPAPTPPTNTTEVPTAAPPVPTANRPKPGRKIQL